VSKNPFTLFFGPADSSGSIEVTRAQLIKEGERLADFFVMDHGHPERSWDGRIKVAPFARSDIASALDAFRTFGAVWPYPPGFKDQLLALDAELLARQHEQLGAEAMIEPPNAATLPTVTKTAGQ